ncbi:MAG TPA: UDP-N-acetylglucosamine 1-carboxyvinyltransferase [Bryobacterales bacterium]|nr:UDP-N-acetylglucosamine 1-carboxyvinyltransferase [Bryobacterales bacterium]
MDTFIIEGGHPLSGAIPVSGAKNAALPVLAATLLTSEEVILERIPKVRDIRTMASLLESVGAEVTPNNGGYRVRVAKITSPEAPYELVKTMRASSLVLGPLVARCGEARVSMPGGCAIGARPINLHLAGLEKLGAKITQEHGYIRAHAPRGLKGGFIHFDRVTVTGTEDLMMAAVLALGETTIENAALEPEVADLADLLTKMGARIEGAGTSTIRIQGVSELHGATHAIIPDRIEAGTFLIAGALAGDPLTVCGVNPDHVSALTDKMRQAGVEFSFPAADRIEVRATGALRAVDLATKEYPGFATDMQAQFLAMMTQARGESQIIETIFENRFMHVSELLRMGADITLDGNRATVRGKTELSGAKVMASDLRASASLVIAALTARGETVIDRVYHIDRGYERIEEKLRGVGARIRRGG